MLDHEQIYVRHKFSSVHPSSSIRTLIIGTFNPDASMNKAEFFYGSRRNYLWRILAQAFGHAKVPSTRNEQEQFIELYHIGFIDLIAEVIVPRRQENNRSDRYIDSRVVQWTDVVSELRRLAYLERVCLSRKTLSGIPNIRARVECVKAQIGADVLFKCLVSPARFYSERKAEEWKGFLLAKARPATGILNGL